MKAKDYHSKYREYFDSSNFEKVNYGLTLLINELFCEIHEMIQNRGIKTDSALMGLYKEQNQKYNSIISKCTKYEFLRNYFIKYVVWMILKSNFSETKMFAQAFPGVNF